jgi:hypothetical protein
MGKYFLFYFLATGKIAEGKIGINWPNVTFFVSALAAGFVLGKII